MGPFLKVVYAMSEDVSAYACRLLYLALDTFRVPADGGYLKASVMQNRFWRIN